MNRISIVDGHKEVADWQQILRWVDFLFSMVDGHKEFADWQQIHRWVEFL